MKQYIITYDISTKINEPKHQDFKNALYKKFALQENDFNLSDLPNTTILISTKMTDMEIYEMIVLKLKLYKITSLLIIEHTGYEPICESI